MMFSITSKILNRGIILSQLRHVGTATMNPIKSVLIANRGEIAIRVGRTASDLGIRCTLIYTDPDLKSQHTHTSPFAINLGPPSAYLDGEKIIAIAKEQGCEALHPGYGFLSENSNFARRCSEEGLVFIGPSSKSIEAMGNKSKSKHIMLQAGVPCIPGYHGPKQNPEFLLNQSKNIGFPIMIKATKGGGGKGMRIATHEIEFFKQLESAKSEAMNSFGDDAVLIEKYIPAPRHIEVQIFGDKYGNIVALGDRDCSIQRRHQKIIEEAPAPGIADDLRHELWEKAIAVAAAVNYEGAGTVEFLFDTDTKNFYFMEMNTRLQVEHPVTEAIIGEDLVAWQFKVAAGEPLPLDQNKIAQRLLKRLWALEARIYAEKPEQDFMPDSGIIRHLKTPNINENVRIDTGFIQGDTVSSCYDGMISKLIVCGSSRRLAIQRLHAALQQYEVGGLSTNIEFLKRICRHSAFADEQIETGFIQKHHDDLFIPVVETHETYAQAALGFQFKSSLRAIKKKIGPHGMSIGFGDSPEREILFESMLDSENGTVQVVIKASSFNCFTIKVRISNCTKIFKDVVCEYNDLSIISFFPNERICSTVIVDKNNVTVFQKGQKTELRVAQPYRNMTTLDLRYESGSVFAPMPCKILRIVVNEGDKVEKDDPLVVIESMKMETTVRSPRKGEIAKQLVKEGDICKSGTKLIYLTSI